MKHGNIIIRTARRRHIGEISQWDPLPRQTLLGCIDEGGVLAAQMEGRLVGALRYNMFWRAIPFLEHIYIDPQMRSMGVGSTLLKHWEDKMFLVGFEYSMTSTQADESAYIFYEKMGYRKIGCFHPPFQSASELMYIKSLTGKAQNQI